MTTPTVSHPVKEIVVDMGQIVVGQSPQRIRAIVGSCIGVVLYHPGRKTGVMSHIVLPDSAGRRGMPGKFVDTAVSRMIELLQESGASLRGATAKLAGGANMFGGTGPLQIGDANAEASPKRCATPAYPSPGRTSAGREDAASSSTAPTAK